MHLWPNTLSCCKQGNNSTLYYTSLQPNDAFTEALPTSAYNQCYLSNLWAPPEAYKNCMCYQSAYKWLLHKILELLFGLEIQMYTSLLVLYDAIPTNKASVLAMLIYMIIIINTEPTFVSNRSVMVLCTLVLVTNTHPTVTWCTIWRYARITVIFLYWNQYLQIRPAIWRIVSQRWWWSRSHSLSCDRVN